MRILSPHNGHKAGPHTDPQKSNCKKTCVGSDGGRFENGQKLLSPIQRNDGGHKLERAICHC